MIHKSSVFLIAATIAMAALSTQAAELHVVGGETYTTIQSAIDAAEPNDIVIVADGAPDCDDAVLYFDGSIDEVRIYDRALSEQEIAALAELKLIVCK